MRRTRGAGLVFAVAALLVAAVVTPVALASSERTDSGGTLPAGDLATDAARGLSTVGTGGWQVQSSAIATESGQRISAPGFDTGGWLSVTPDDAGAPGTEIEALLQNGACPNVFYSDNMRKCFGYVNQVGPVTTARFAVPWWFRTDFTPNVKAGQAAQLIVNGVVGKADVWVNGHQVATSSTVTGAYTRFTFDVASLLRQGRNSVALEVYPNDPTTMFTLDDVDWNQIPPDNNTGIHFPLQLRVSNALTDSNARVVEHNAADLSSSALTVKTDITNNTGAPQTGLVTATVTPPSGGGVPITVRQSVTVAPHATQTVSFTPSQYGKLTIAHPQVWWPYQMGRQPLYRLTTAVSQGGVVSNSTQGDFGIRTVTSSLIGSSPAAPDGVRAYAINGRPFVIRGAGIAEDLFLHYSSADIAGQIALLKNMGLNMVRVEGHFFPDDFYQQMDRAGIMIDAGYQCCDAWELPTDGSGVTDADYHILALSALTVGQNLRNHPSVVTFSWSDNAPTPKQEAVSLQAFREADFDQPLISSAEYKASPVLGPSGEKEGPYDYVPPSYWYDTSHFDSNDPTRTNVGGSWGLDSEQSAGHTVPTIDSMRRFMTEHEQAQLWQNPSYNQYHANYEPGTSGYAFGTLYNFDTALAARYGQWSDLESFVRQAQVQNYENTRAQFEAFLHHSTNQPTPATGTIYWQANKGWPSLLWNLYNNDGDQAGSYFGAKKANEPLHVLYGYDDNTVTVDNVGPRTQSELSVQAKVYDVAGNLLDDQTAGDLSLASQQVRNGVLRPKVPAPTTAPAPAGVYFVELLLRQGDTVVDRNVYWLSTQADVVNWPATQGKPQATMSQYANLRALQSLPTATVTAEARTWAQPGPNGADRVTEVTITNTSRARTVGFFQRADLRRGNQDGTEQPGDNQVTSAIWGDNDVTLWPGESQTLTVSYRSTDLRGATPVVSVSGWNVPRFDVTAWASPERLPG